MLPAGVVITGGGSKMLELVNLTKNVLRLPVQIGYPIELNGIIDRVDDPSFATVMGLVLWEADENGVFLSGGEKGLLKMPSFDGIGQGVRKIFKTFLP